MKYKKICILLLSQCLISASVFAAASLQDMKTCQGVLDFVNKKLDSAPKKYSSSDISNIRKGLKDFDKHIQKTNIEPGIYPFVKGNKKVRVKMEEDIVKYRADMVNRFEKFYPKNEMHVDFAKSLNDCGQKSMPSGSTYDSFKLSLETIFKLAQIK